LAQLRARDLPPTLQIDEARLLVNIGRSTAYENCQRHGYLVPGVPVLKVSDRCFRVPTSVLLRFLGLEDPPAMSAAGAPPEAA
jgi:hypothetical protein